MVHITCHEKSSSGMNGMVELCNILLVSWPSCVLAIIATRADVRAIRTVMTLNASRCLEEARIDLRLMELLLGRR